ncbi:MAG TPA: PIG-L family deacetylase [Acidimicrobiales bacterium]|nr:PIG-L family deacetylase [Acidimicrobiales bacterium]
MSEDVAAPTGPGREEDLLVAELGVEAPSWGLLEAGVLERIVVVSPHFDDAVLGTAHLLATYPGSAVLTVFGGKPVTYPDPPSDWDAAGGFTSGDDVVARRREEDRAATASLRATSSWLDFPDHQYLAPGARPRPADVAPVLTDALTALSPSAVFVPMGLANPDHDVTHDAALAVRASLAGTPDEPSWFCYEDHGYKHLPGLLAWRVAKLLRSGTWPTPAVVPVEVDMAAKRAAIAHYVSQVAPLERDHVLAERLDANVPEQYWRLAPPPRGWEALSEFI